MNSETSFQEFWTAYPRKQNKKKALGIWNKIILDDGLCKKIMASLEAHKKSKQWLRDEGQFIPMPSTWLFGERWDDVVKIEMGSSLTRPYHKRYVPPDWMTGEPSGHSNGSS